MLNREAILGAQDLKIVDVDVPEWGGQVRVRMMTGTERTALLARSSVNGQVDTDLFSTTLIEMTTVDEAGNRVFADGDAAALGQKASAALTRVFSASSRLNRLNGDAVEAAEKNSAATASVASS